MVARSAPFSPAPQPEPLAQPDTTAGQDGGIVVDLAAARWRKTLAQVRRDTPGGAA
ncbi:hypothetical protein [Jatrophihabitans sp.]|uniref:hypothetical protein n=1 Tax=Jatrophihabitans sp. TaxID=1932789 RepID=UPI0030C6A274|nr:hypothetical protein [Jatrophihabitans sp.]